MTYKKPAKRDPDAIPRNATGEEAALRKLNIGLRDNGEQLREAAGTFAQAYDAAGPLTQMFLGLSSTFKNLVDTAGRTAGLGITEHILLAVRGHNDDAMRRSSWGGAHENSLIELPEELRNSGGATCTSLFKRAAVGRAFAEAVEQRYKAQHDAHAPVAKP